MPHRASCNQTQDTANSRGPASVKLTVVAGHCSLYPAISGSWFLRMLALHADCLAPRKTRSRSPWLLCLLLVPTLSVLAKAQSTEFLPEIDVYYSINPLVRTSFQAKQTREGGDPTQAEIGPSVEFYLKPWIKLQNATTFDLDQAKKRALVFSTGYRVLLSPGAATTNRWELIATANFPLRGGFLLADRNRADLDWQSGKFDWRYRNRLSLER